MNRKKLREYKKNLHKIIKKQKIKENFRSVLKAKALLRDMPHTKLLFPDNKPLLLSLLKEEEAPDTEYIIRLLEPFSENMQNCDFSSLRWQTEYHLLSIGSENTADDIDFCEIVRRLSPLHNAYMSDESYRLSTPESRDILRYKTERTAAETGIPESRLMKEYLRTAENNGISLSEVICEDYNRVFPCLSPIGYGLGILFISALLTVITRLFTDPAAYWLFTPFIGIVKTVTDRILLNRSEKLPALSYTAEEAKRYKTVCALSVLADSPESIKNGVKRLLDAKLRNNGENLRFCLLCDLPPSDMREADSDGEILSAVRDNRSDVIILVRNRDFSRTQNLYQGKERKRGAIDDLIRFINGESISFRLCSGDISELRTAPFICALDYDTQPFMDTVNALVATAIQPSNRKYGIIAPRITTSLSSSFRTGLSRIFGGNGGCSGISVYDSIDTELYSECFGEGTFTGKGLIRTGMYAEKISGYFPDEKILSHDILEGGVLGVLYCGDIEFNDSFPPTTKGYFRRQHRWLRGDFQNIPRINDKSFSVLTRIKLWDNVRRGIEPIYCVIALFAAVAGNNVIAAAIAVLSVILPGLQGLISAAVYGFGFSNTREFHSPFLSLSRTLFSRISAEVIFLMKNAVNSADALIRTAVRFISGRKLLEWQTASVLDKVSAVGYGGFIIPQIISLIYFAYSIKNNSLFSAFIGIMMCLAPVAAICMDKVISAEKTDIKKENREILLSEAEKEWRFFIDNVTEDENFLPPDNVQYTPVPRTAHRTSPTNIGMYLLSCVSAVLLGISDSETAVTYIKRTVETVKKLKKYYGNLYNWYDTTSLLPMGDFVSSVDSGNFICCLVAVKEWLGEKTAESLLIKDIEDIINGADLTVFYSSTRNLFSTGINADSHTHTKNYYDMLMSEARMLSYFSIASGQAPKKHWQSLSRTMGRSGKYAGPMAWTGTMFEFFMPELLLDSKRGSLSYEALSFAVYCQKERGKKRRLPFGISESGFFSFDKELNFLYKPHGVQALALCGGMNKEYVISPYSTLLALSHSFSACMNNYMRLNQPRFSHSSYGLYEAIDMTAERTGGGEGIVKSHMSHHMGMSLCGICNALTDNKLRQLFLSDPLMARGSELLEERIMTGERIMNTDNLKDKRLSPVGTEESSVFSFLRPETTVIANRKLAVFVTDTGLYYGRYDNISTAVKSPDFFRRPKGMFFGIKDGIKELPFFITAYDRTKGLQRSVTFTENTAEYYVNSSEIKSGMKISVFGENAAETREFSIENTGGYEKTVNLTAYIEPCLISDAAYSSHPAFSDLFIKTEYDPSENVVIVWRKERDSDKRRFMCIGFKEAAAFNFSFNREKLNAYNSPFRYFINAGSGTNDSCGVPNPCVFIDLPIKLGIKEKFSTEMFVCYGESRNEVLGICHDIRGGAEYSEAISPLPLSTLHGQICRKVLTPLIYGNIIPEETLNAKTSLHKSALHRFGINENIPFLLCRHDGDELKLMGMISAVCGLNECMLETVLVIICTTKSEQKRISELLSAENANAVVITDGSLSEEEKGLLYKSAAFILGKSSVRKPPEKIMEISACEPLKTPDNEGFTDDRYVTDKKGHPHINVLASRQFGTILSNNSLGFSFALNSRLNMLTPWYNDIMTDNNGEMLLLWSGGEYKDIICGARTVFSPDKADYYSRVKNLSFHSSVRVFKKGMGKEITVRITNNSSYEKSIRLSYYTEPVLGENRNINGNGRFLCFREDNNAVFIRGTGNADYKGEMGLYCNRETVKTADREGFFGGKAESPMRPYPFGCCALTAKLSVKPKSTEEITFIMSFSVKNGMKQINALKNAGTDFIKENNEKLDSNSPILNKLYDYWLPWQIIGCRMWARSGFYQNGGAFGFRDQLQDSMAAAFFMPKEAKRQILRCCCAQFSDGDVLHWWHKTDSCRKGVRTTCSDDLLWLPYATAHYIKITGDDNILGLNTHYISGEELNSRNEIYMEVKNTDVRENVYLHCKKAFEKGFKKGSKGFLKIGGGDWNDGYNRIGADGRGESVWLSMFYILAVKEFLPLARKMSDDEYALELEKRAAELTVTVMEKAFKNGYFIRAVYDNGKEMGSDDSEACKIDLLPQAFSVLSDIPDREKRSSALKSAYDKLVDEENGVIKLFDPPFMSDSEDDPGYVKSYPEGIRENGGQYTHAAVWLALAFLRNNDKETAKRLINMLNPAARGSEFMNEPYYMTADIYTNPLSYGRGGWSAYTGSAAWYYMLLREMYKE